MNSLKSLFASAGVVALSVLTGCSDSTSTAASNIIDITPSKGAFSTGAVVEVYDAASGAKVGSGTVAPSGKASIDTGTTKGAIILKVVSGSYYDEGTDSTLTLDEPLLSMVPAATAGGNFGVTPLTNMAAAMAGVTATSTASGLTIPTGGVSSTTITSNNGALLSLLGLDATSFDIAAAPTLVTSRATSLSSGAAGLYALVLAKISYDAQAAVVAGCSTASCKASRMLSDLKSAAVNAYNSPTKTFSAPAALGINATTGMTFTNVTSMTGATAASTAVAAKAAAPVTTITDAQNVANASIYCANSTTKLDPLYAGNAATLSSALTTGTGTYIITVNGTNYTYNITYANGKIYGIPNAGSGAQSGVFTGSVSGSSAGSDGYLSNTLYLLSGISGSGTLTLNYSGGSGTYTLGMGSADATGQKKVTLTCS